MAATTLKAVIDRFQAVLEGANLNLRKSTDEFSFDQQPNTKLNQVYRVEDAGLSETQTLTNNVDARVDSLSVWLARKATPDAQAERETLETTLLTAERQIVADGPSNNYHASVSAREIERTGDVLVARLEVLVDYDVSLATT
jgi:preprotein translocase subunit SecA